MGKQYVLGLKAVNCGNGETLAEEQVTAVKKEKVLEVLGGASRKLREELGESLHTVQEHDTPIEQATTPSLEALKAYSVGWKASFDKGDAEAVPLFRRAIELDPNFALAYAELGSSYATLQEPGLASDNLAKAYELRGRVSEREQFRISASYYMRVTEELEKANETLALWA